MTYCLEKNPVSILWMWLFCVMSNDSSCITSYLLILRMHPHKETLCLIFFLFSLARPILVVCVFRDLTLQNPFITSMLLSPFMSQTVYNLLLGYMREWDITFSIKNFLSKVETCVLCDSLPLGSVEWEVFKDWKEGTRLITFWDSQMLPVYMHAHAWTSFH